MGRVSTARMLSIAAHPALLMPVAVVGAAVARGAPRTTTQTAVVASVGVAIAVLGYSFVRVRVGHWSHADASRPAEPVQLNLFLVLVLLGVATSAYVFLHSATVAFGALLCAAQVGVALVAGSWQQPSLHASFAVYSAALWWPIYAAVVVLLLLAAGVVWSRLALGRHTRAELVVGVAMGMAAGLAFQGLAPQHGA